MAKFKYGDMVLAGKNRAKVISIYKKGNDYMCRVRFENVSLIPREMDYPESFLCFEEDYPFCPVCKSDWNVTKFNMHVWKDCRKCGKKFEDVVEEFEKKSTNYDNLHDTSWGGDYWD